MTAFKPISAKRTLIRAKLEISPKTAAALCLSTFVGLSLVACGIAPIAGQSLTNLRVNEATDADANGETVRWGGTIAAIKNTDNGSIVEIVSRPLNDWGRPKRNDQTYGRFIAHLDQILDPQKIKKGMDVTIIGELTAVEVGAVGERPYQFPVLRTSKLRVWQPEIHSVPYSFGYWQDPFIKDLPHGEHQPYSEYDRQEGQFTF